MGVNEDVDHEEFPDEPLGPREPMAEELSQFIARRDVDKETRVIIERAIGALQAYYRQIDEMKNIMPL